MSEENKNTQYRMLDESGLWEDEEGNLYSSSELEDYEPMDPAIQKNISERLKKVSATRCLLARNIKWVYINRNGEVVRAEE